MKVGIGIHAPSKQSLCLYLKYLPADTASWFVSIWCDKPIMLTFKESNEKKGPVFFSYKETTFYTEWVSLVDLIFKEERHSFFKLLGYPFFI